MSGDGMQRSLTAAACITKTVGAQHWAPRDASGQRKLLRPPAPNLYDLGPVIKIVPEPFEWNGLHTQLSSQAVQYVESCDSWYQTLQRDRVIAAACPFLDLVSCQSHSWLFKVLFQYCVFGDRLTEDDQTACSSTCAISTGQPLFTQSACSGNIDLTLAYSSWEIL